MSVAAYSWFTLHYRACFIMGSGRDTRASLFMLLVSVFLTCIWSPNCSKYFFSKGDRAKTIRQRRNYSWLSWLCISQYFRNAASHTRLSYMLLPWSNSKHSSHPTTPLIHSWNTRHLLPQFRDSGRRHILQLFFSLKYHSSHHSPFQPLRLAQTWTKRTSCKDHTFPPPYPPSWLDCEVHTISLDLSLKRSFVSCSPRSCPGCCGKRTENLHRI